MSKNTLFSVPCAMARVLSRVWGKSAQPITTLLPAFNMQEMKAFCFLRDKGVLKYYAGLDEYQIDAVNIGERQFIRMMKAVMTVKGNS